MLKYLRDYAARAVGRPSSVRHSDRKLVDESDLFDSRYYIENYQADMAAGRFKDPLMHYLRVGGFKGNNPSAKFDSSAYLAHYPEVRAAKFNPLLHYLRHGRHEGRAIFAVVNRAPPPNVPTKQQWDELFTQVKTAQLPEPVIDVVIPAFRGYVETASCLYTAIRSKLDCKTPFELVLIDDASPEAKIVALLDDLHRRGLITLLRHKKNSGFVISVNNGMTAHPERDVILLNSDTEVYGNWLDRLRSAAYSAEEIGTVTPFSNNATICSYPVFPGEFKGTLEISFADLDRIAAKANAGKIVDIPTAVGFCMYIRRECLKQVGLFDDRAFGLGYGEENDFSLRALGLGWRNVLAGDVFVRHFGRVSFLDSTEKRVKKGLEVIKQRYPSYLSDIATHIRRDPAKFLRRNLDKERIRRAIGDRNILFAFHSLGGGTAKHVKELSSLIQQEGFGVLWLQPKASPGHVAVLRSPKVQHLSNGADIDFRYGLEATARFLTDLGIIHFHVHHTLGFSPQFPEWIQRVSALCKIQYDVTIHDYFLACPRITMIDESGRYCGNSQLEKCETCIRVNGSPMGALSVWQWRDTHAKFLSAARKIFVPNESVRHYMAPFFTGLQFCVREHPENPPPRPRPPIPRQAGQPLKIAVIGAIGEHKGSKVLQQCAADALQRRLPIQFHVFGYTDIADLRALPNVRTTGEYTEETLSQLLAQQSCHIAFFPAVWPETYSYTLSQAWFAGVWPVAFDLGAIAERIKRVGWGALLPFEMASDPARVNDKLLSFESQPQPEGFDPVPGRRLYRSIWEDYYQLPNKKTSGAVNSRPNLVV